MTSSKELIEALARDLKPVKPARSPWLTAMGAWLGVLALVTLAFAAALRLRPGIPQKLAEFYFLLQLTVALAASYLAASAAIQIGLPGRASPARQKILGLALPATLALLLGLRTLGAALQPESSIRCGWGEMSCTLTILALSVAPALFLTYRARAYASIAPTWSGVLIGVAASALASAALAFHCTVDTPWHLLLWHWALPLGVTAVACRLLAARFLRW